MDRKTFLKVKKKLIEGQQEPLFKAFYVYSWLYQECVFKDTHTIKTGLRGTEEVKHLIDEGLVIKENEKITLPDLKLDVEMVQMDSVVNRVIDYLNKACEKGFKKSTEANRSPIRGRLKDGFTEDHLKKVIDQKNKEWGRDPVMNKFLRPITLFSPSKFEGYVSSLPTRETRMVKVKDPFGKIQTIPMSQLQKAESGYFTIIDG